MANLPGAFNFIELYRFVEGLFFLATVLMSPLSEGSPSPRAESETLLSLFAWLDLSLLSLRSSTSSFNSVLVLTMLSSQRVGEQAPLLCPF